MNINHSEACGLCHTNVCHHTQEALREAVASRMGPGKSVLRRPTYNHTREDSPLYPCPECAALADAGKWVKLERLEERLACARIAAQECPCKLPLEQCHVAQEILLRREEEEGNA